MNKKLFKKIEINSKVIFITDKHHHSIIPWALYRKRQDKGLVILSLDHHLDTRDPFTHYAFDHSTMIYNSKKADNELKKMDFKQLNTIEHGILNLKNDEHIKTAIQIDIIDKIFVVSYIGADDSPVPNEIKKYNKEVIRALKNRTSLPQKPLRPYTYPDARIYIVENLCSTGCTKRPHNDDCVIPHFNQAIETIFLNDKLDIIENMDTNIISNGKFKKKFVLDIDLDYFHTCQSIRPNDSKTFHYLIKASDFITITKEEEFVAEWINEYQYDTNLSVDYLIDELIVHIEQATK